MPIGIYARSEEHKRNLGLSLRGKKRTDEQKGRMRNAKLGKVSPKKGMSFPQYQRENASNWKGGKPHCIDCGETISYGHIRCSKDYLKYIWRGKDVGIGSLHDWVKSRKPKVKLCELCYSKPPYDCANISGRYLRDIDDYEWLCRRCHMLKDGRLAQTILRNRGNGLISNV